MKEKRNLNLTEIYVDRFYRIADKWAGVRDCHTLKSTCSHPDPERDYCRKCLERRADLKDTYKDGE